MDKPGFRFGPQDHPAYTAANEYAKKLILYFGFLVGVAIVVQTVKYFQAPSPDTKIVAPRNIVAHQFKPGDILVLRNPNKTQVIALDREAMVEFYRGVDRNKAGYKADGVEILSKLLDQGRIKTISSKNRLQAIAYEEGSSKDPSFVPWDRVLRVRLISPGIQERFFWVDDSVLKRE
jgi:hypothetical protein